VADEALCPRCSAGNPNGTAFCGKCGFSLDITMMAEAEPEPDPLIGALVGGRFLVKRRLGEGGMGVVYEAVQTSIGRRVALKVLHPHLTDASLFARFRNEAAAASRLDHPNTITVFDFGETETGSLYIAMELIEGVSLDDEIRREDALEWPRAARIARQICGSLANAHENGVVHRDLKPENVMLVERGTEKDLVKVVDFGIAKIMEDDGTDKRQALTKTGMVFGTPQYMSPEQIRGEKVDARSDIYSTGVIFYQMLTGALPFISENPMGLLTKHLMDAPPPFAQVRPANQVPPELERLVMQTLAKSAAQRPQTMRELAERIDALPESSTAAAAKRKGRVGMIAGIAIGAVLLLGGGGAAVWYFVAGPGHGEPQQPVTQIVMTPVAPPVAGPQNPVASPATGPNNAQPPEIDTAPLPAIPSDKGGDVRKPKEKSPAHKPKMPIDLGKDQDEIVSSVKDTLSQLRKKLEELKTGRTETDAGN
jgi:tRNA A-37 threonylcarbamoyl transferase component Bud32